MGKIIKNGITYGGGSGSSSVSASTTIYNNLESQLESTNVQDAIDELENNKVDKVSGKGLSTNDFTTNDKNQITTNKNDITELKEDLTILEDDAKINIIGTNFTDGYYCNYNNGQLVQNDDYTVTGFIEVKSNTVYNCKGSSFVCYFNENEQFFDSVITVNTDGTFTTHALCKYIRISIPINSKNKVALIKSSTPPIIYAPNGESTEYAKNTKTEIHVGVGQEYTSILKALKDSGDEIDIYVHDGIYELYTEYINYYGANFWVNYRGYDGYEDVFLRGLYLSPNRKIYFSSKATVSFTPPLAKITPYMREHFSIFAPTYNNEIHDAFIQIEANSCEYFIHDDFSNYHENASMTFKGCVFKGTPYGNASIGAGCGSDVIYRIEDCIFIENNGAHDISYHNTTAGGTDNKCKIYVTNCYGNNKLAFRWYGESTAITYCIVSNCRFGSIVAEAYDSEQVNENMVMIKWNNIETN